MIANAVNIEHPAIRRAPANTIKDDSDLCARLVTVDVPPLRAAEVRAALGAGASFARDWLASGQIHSAMLLLQGDHLAIAAQSGAQSGGAQSGAQFGAQSCLNRRFGRRALDRLLPDQSIRLAA